MRIRDLNMKSTIHYFQKIEGIAKQNFDILLCIFQLFLTRQLSSQIKFNQISQLLSNLLIKYLVQPRNHTKNQLKEFSPQWQHNCIEQISISINFHQKKRCISQSEYASQHWKVYTYSLIKFLISRLQINELQNSQRFLNPKWSKQLTAFLQSIVDNLSSRERQGHRQILLQQQCQMLQIFYIFAKAMQNVILLYQRLQNTAMCPCIQLQLYSSLDAAIHHNIQKEFQSNLQISFFMGQLTNILIQQQFMAIKYCFPIMFYFFCNNFKLFLLMSHLHTFLHRRKILKIYLFNLLNEYRVGQEFHLDIQLKDLLIITSQAIADQQASKNE